MGVNRHLLGNKDAIVRLKLRIDEGDDPLLALPLAPKAAAREFITALRRRNVWIDCDQLNLSVVPRDEKVVTGAVVLVSTFGNGARSADQQSKQRRPNCTSIRHIWSGIDAGMRESAKEHRERWMHVLNRQEPYSVYP